MPSSGELVQVQGMGEKKLYEYLLTVLDTPQCKVHFNKAFPYLYHVYL